MKSGAKGLLVFAVLALVAGLGWWLLQGEGGALKLEPRGAGGSQLASGELGAPAGASDATRLAAERAKEAPANSLPAPAEPAANVPLADFLAGVVVDPNGRPIAGAEVSFGPQEAFNFNRRGRFALSFGRPSDGRAPSIQAKTGDDGAFRLANVARVEGMSLKVDHADYVVYTRGDLILPKSGMELGRITLQPGAIVTGQVFGPGGAKLAGAEVSLRDAPEESRRPGAFFGMGFGPRGTRVTKTDAEGRFRLSGMPAGPALVLATSEGLCEAESAPVTLVALQETGGVVLRLERGDTLTGIVRDGGGKPIAEANVDAWNEAVNDFRRFAGGGLRAKTGSDGRFSIPGVERGRYSVMAEAPGFAPATAQGVDSGAGAPVELKLGASAHVAGLVRVKGSGELAKNVKVQLLPYWGENNAISLPFDVPDSENQSTGDGSFLIKDVDPGQYRVQARGDGTTRALSAPITIDDDTNIDDLSIEVERGAVLTGRVVDAATGAPLEGVDVACYAQSEQQPPPTAAAVPGAPRNLSVRTSRVSMRGGARVDAYDPTRRRVGAAKSDADGRFEIQHLAAGSYVLDATHADYATTRSSSETVAAAESKRAGDVALGRGGSVEGNVVGIDGQPRAGDRVDVESKSVPGVTRSAVADANGWYHVDHVPAGDALARRNESDGGGPGGFVYRAVIEGEEEPEQGKRIEVAEGETVRVDFSQMDKPFVEGTVSCADGPVAGALVTARPAGEPGGMGFFGGPRKEATTGPDGRFRLADLDPGSWTISARHPQGLVPTTASVKLDPGVPGRQDFFLDGGVVEGDVLAQKDKAKVSGATISLERVRESGEDGNDLVMGDMVISFAAGRRGRGGGQVMRFGGPGGADSRVTSDRDGHFRIPWVPAGKYRVTASHDGFLDTRSEEIEVTPSGHVNGADVALPPAARLRVKLRSKETGEALANCPVHLSTPEGDSSFAISDSEGIAHFDRLKPATWTASGQKSWNDRDARTQSVTCEAERTAEITIDM
jgi:protocatechuate 3,4-dioxygenase beta subunit